MSKIKILQINKLYAPWIGGIEFIAKSIAEGLHDETAMTVLACQPKGKGVKEKIGGVDVVKAGSIGIHFSMPISFSFPFLVRKYAKKSDIVILHNPFPLGDLAVLMSRFRGKIILFWHSDIVRQKRLAKLIMPIIKGILRRSDAIFATSEGYIDGSAYLKDYRRKCRLIPYGIDPKKYLDVSLTPVLTKELKDSASKKILFVGRLVYYKGVSVLIEAFQKVKNAAELFIVGRGDDEEALREQALSVRNRVHFMGALSDEDLKSAFADCDFFVLPSVENSEAFGIVQLEAMIYGKPVINTDLKTSVPLVSLHNETGLTVRPGDVDDLAAAMDRLIADEDLRVKFGNAAQKRVLERFDLDSMVNNVKDQIYNIMMEE